MSSSAGGIAGADIAKLRELSGKFKTESSNLHTLIKHLQSATTDSEHYWKGPNAEKFRSEWAQLKPTFDKFVQTLSDAQSNTNSNATAIAQATGSH